MFFVCASSEGSGKNVKMRRFARPRLLANAISIKIACAFSFLAKQRLQRIFIREHCTEADIISCCNHYSNMTTKQNILHNRESRYFGKTAIKLRLVRASAMNRLIRRKTHCVFLMHVTKNRQQKLSAFGCILLSRLLLLRHGIKHAKGHNS